MDQAHIAAIQRNFQSLIAQTDLHVMVTTLYEKGVFSEQMIEPYKNPNIDERTHKRNFYFHLMRRGPDAFGHLIDTLWEIGLWNLARDLDPIGEFHNRPRNPIEKSNDESNFISISSEKKKALSEAETKKDVIQLPYEHLRGDYVPSFKVEKSSNLTKDECTDINIYEVRGERRQRVMLLYTYMTFDNGIESPRPGADIDTANLKYLFDELGFTVISYMNLDKKETIEGLEKLPHTLEGVKCVFVAVSSHGYDRSRTTDMDFRCKDGQLISVYDFIDYFNNQSLPQLRGVPKVFIFQTCRGNKSHYSHHYSSGETMDGWSRGAEGPAAPLAARGAAPFADGDCTSRVYSDILIAHSTVPGYVSRRIPEKGSWYIQTLCKVFAEHAHEMHVEELFTLVDKQMAANHLYQTSSVEKWGFNSRLYLQSAPQK